MKRPPGVTEFLTTRELLSQPKWEDPLNQQERAALLEIGRRAGLGPKEVGEKIGAEKDMMSKITKKLVKLGFVFERKNPEDRRYTQLGMTKAGERAMYDWVQYKYNKPPGSFKIKDIEPWEGGDLPKHEQPEGE
jgi:DNA-binding MarR family transcriptional regulator